MHWRSKALIHIAYWVYRIMVLWFFVDQEHYEPDNALNYFTNYSASWLGRMTTFYLHYVLIIPLLLLRARYFWFGFATILLTVSGYFFHSMAWNGFDVNYLFSPRSEHVWGLFYDQFYTLTAVYAITFFERWVTSENKKQALLEEMKMTELQLLKSQMSPHFLFNTLNNIYSLSYQNKPETAAATTELKALMGYMELFEKNEKITLETELNCLKSFVALNALRHKVKVSFSHQINESRKEIESMLLLPFIENAFKHGETHAENELNIELNEDLGVLRFSVKNTFDPNKRKDSVSGVGIKNVKKRIDLIYGTNGKVDISKENQTYNVKIELKLI